jgi:hypothetical protein
MSGDDQVEVRLSVHELEIIDRSLKVVKELGAPPEEKDILEDALQLVDVALSSALSNARAA